MVFEQYRDFIPDFDRFQETLLRPLPIHLRVNTLKTDPDSVLKSMGERGQQLEKSFEGCHTLYRAPGLTSPGTLLEYFLGYIHPQALTSCLTSIALSPRKRSSVLDLCAAPGGKASHMAAIMKNTGLIVANEPHSGRQRALGHTLDRLGVCNAVITGYPAQQFPLRQRFDFILADVPCSGEGTFRKIRDSSEHRVSANHWKLQDLQRKIIVRAFDLLAENGFMLYSTCTYNPEENEAVVNFLLENRNAVVHAVNTEVPHETGITEWRDGSYDKQLERTARWYPHRVESVGFFMARIGKPG